MADSPSPYSSPGPVPGNPVSLHADMQAYIRTPTPNTNRYRRQYHVFLEPEVTPEEPSKPEIEKPNNMNEGWDHHNEDRGEFQEAVPDIIDVEANNVDDPQMPVKTTIDLTGASPKQVAIDVLASPSPQRAGQVQAPVKIGMSSPTLKRSTEITPPNSAKKQKFGDECRTPPVIGRRRSPSYRSTSTPESKTSSGGPVEEVLTPGEKRAHEKRSRLLRSGCVWDRASFPRRIGCVDDDGMEGPTPTADSE